MTAALPEYPLNIFDAAVRADPYPYYEEMRGAGRVVANPFLLGQLMVPGYDDVAALLSDPERFCMGPLWGPMSERVFRGRTMLTADPPEHERLREPVARALTPRSVGGLEPWMRDAARALFSPLAEGEDFELVGRFAQRFPTLVIAELLGVASADLDSFVEWSNGLLGVLDVFGPPERGERAEQCSKQLHDYFSQEAGRRRRHPADDLVGRLVAANADGRLSTNEMLSACVLLLLGGNETTTKLITNGALALARHPEQRARLVADPELLPAAVEELIRFDTPVQGDVRFAARDVEFAGVRIAQGTAVAALLGAANRDPARFENPGRLDVGRNPNPVLSFGRGIHYCLGANLARLEAKVALAALLSAAPEYMIEDSEPLCYDSPTFFFHAPSRLVIRRT